MRGARFQRGGFEGRSFGPRGPRPEGFGPGAGFEAGEGFEGRRGRGAGGFGPGGSGPGGFGPGSGSGPGGFGPGAGFGHRRGRRGRGNVRASILALLAEEPRHGYSIMTELGERSGGLWRPSPGSVYPVLQQLQDEGLLSVEETEGRRVFSLTEAGRRVVEENPAEHTAPWQVAGEGPRQRVQSLFEGMHGLGAATREVARLGTDEQAERARVVLDDARKKLYGILAEDAAPRYGTPSAGDTPRDGTRDNTQDEPRS